MVTFLPKPSESLDPWKAARDSYDDSLEAGIREVETRAISVDARVDAAERSVDALRSNFLAVLSPGLVALGDSNTQATDIANGWSNSWVTFAGVRSGQAIKPIFNAGVGGNTTAMMLARFASSVTAYSPKIVAIMGGTNDIGQSVPAETTQANLEAIVSQVRAIGASPVLCTIPPRADKAAEVRALNRWIRSFAVSEGILLVDFFDVLSDGVSGWRSGLGAEDGVHATPAGYRAMGVRFADVVEPRLLSLFDPKLVTLEDQSGNLLLNGVMGAGAVAGLADKWSLYGGSPAGAVRSLEPAGDGFAQVFSITSGAVSNFGVMQAFSGWVVGDRLRFSARVFREGSGSLVAGVFANSGFGPWQAARNISVDCDGVFSIEFVVPSGVTSLQVVLMCSGLGAGKFSQVTVRKVLNA